MVTVYQAIYKVNHNFITAYPDVQERTLSGDFEFMVLACDGIWDVLSNQEVVDFVRARIAQRIEPEIVSSLMHHRTVMYS